MSNGLELNQELDTAIRLARAAGAAAMAHYGTTEAELKPGDSPVTAADRASNHVIVAGLAAKYPDDAILSEESADSGTRLAMERVWIVDPLDGTKEFLAQNGEFSIMIALAVAGEPALGVVFRPDGDVLFHAARGEGAYVERAGVRRRLACRVADPSALRLVCSRSHADPLVARLQDELGIRDVRPSGSVGLKCGLIAEGECDLYVHPVPYMSEWDTCAPEAVLREAGGFVTDCRGERLAYNKPNPRQPHGIFAGAAGVPDAVQATIWTLYGDAQAADVGRRVEA